MSEMEDKKEKRRQTLLIVIAIGIFLMTIVGVSYAFFTAKEVQGNSDTNTVNAGTVDYGTTTVHYDNDSGVITTGALDLIKGDKGKDYKFLLKFYVDTTSTVDLQLNISWNEITNTFCQYRDGQNCTDLDTDTPVTNEVIYDLYNCPTIDDYDGTTDDFETKTVTIDEDCTIVSTDPSSDVPLTGTSEVLNLAALDIEAAGTNYYALVLTVRNIDGVQNYNQGRAFSGRLNVSILTA